MSTAPLVRLSEQPGHLRKPILGYLFSPAYLALEAGAVMAAMVLSWSIWTSLPFAQPSSLDLHLRLGLGVALVLVLLTVLRGEHRLTFKLADEHRVILTFRAWNLTTALVFLVVFLTRRTDDLSRGVIVLFYGLGMGSLWFARSMTANLLATAREHGLLVARRILVVGTRDGIASFLSRHEPWRFGFEIAGTIPVRVSGGEPGEAELRQAVELARGVQPDDIYLALPWSETAAIDACVEAFLNTPTALHLAPEKVLERFDQIAISRVGALASLELTRPMPALAQAAKRAFDILGALAGLLLLSPLLLLAAVAIKLDSPGPVFFLQTRYGFNQRPFRIFKFRTMTTFSDSGPVAQASRDDPRITRIGRILRRTNIDEIPQLLNVLFGHMSLVGPRPHAVPHNRDYERRIGLYARRHNVRPGITGWAQVNGLRGETDTDEKMRRRVEADLFYIDNWSMLLDLTILARTVLSSKAYTNAY